MARQPLGPMGVCLPVSFTNAADVVAQREAVARLEHTGYQAIWTNEVIGKDAFVQLGVPLAATERMVFGTCIANIWARLAQIT
jgi:alkanesulfonate monooxygenase SsuD/methylene tetrahydromethanopterin reductase-like flavin-dependent oxidoreductase (luciferase family)